ncbi:MAG: class I SAM-dependent methyltransferase [Sciscionella sp.]
MFGRTGLAGLGLRLRHGARGTLLRALEEVIQPYHGEQMEQLSREMASVRGEIQDVRTTLDHQADRLVEFIEAVEIRARRDVFAAGEREAVAEAAALVRAEMREATPFDHPRKTLHHALGLAPSGGLALEFGVYTGATLGVIAEVRGDGQVYGFDSFKGLPEAWRSGFPAGAFSDTTPPSVAGAEVVAGWFDDTLPGFLSEHPGPVDFVHIDCDLYASTTTVLDHVGSRMRAGSVILFDEYFNYPGWREHEFRAWLEYATRTGTRSSYQAYTLDNEQVAIKIEGADTAGDAGAR